VVGAVVAGALALVGTAAPAGAVAVGTEAAFRSAWSNTATTSIELTTDVSLGCSAVTPYRDSTTDIVVDGNGHTLRNTCTTGDHGVMHTNGTGDVTIRDITITGGRAVSWNGGAVRILGESDNLTIEDATFTNNTNTTGGAGGAVASAALENTIRDSTFTGNHTAGPGSAFVTDTPTLIERSTFTGNLGSAETVVANGGLEVIDSVSTGNVGDGFYGSGPVTLTRTTVADNGEDGVGSGGLITLTESTVEGNGRRGITANGGSLVVSSTIHGNVTEGIRTGNATVVHSTVTANGQNVYAPINTLTTFGSVFADPTGPTSCNVSATTNQGYSIADDATCGPGLTVVASPLQLGALADNGGSTATRMPAVSSPLVDVIPIDDCDEVLTGDQRSFARPGDDEGCDVGAVEVCQDGTFPDVALTNQFAGDICWMGVQGITTGFGDGTYKPSNPVSRQAMSAFMYRLAGSPPFSAPDTPTFGDVSATNDFYLEIEWMADEGITTGTPASPKPLYKPSAAVSRQAMSAFMFRLAGSPPFSAPVTPTFADVSPTNDFYDEIEWMADEGITTGFNTTPRTYAPSAAVSRQAMSAFMRRLAEGPGVDIDL
jgi:hypothetical protein